MELKMVIPRNKWNEILAGVQELKRKILEGNAPKQYIHISNDKKFVTLVTLKSHAKWSFNLYGDYILVSFEGSVGSFSKGSSAFGFTHTLIKNGATVVMFGPDENVPEAKKELHVEWNGKKIFLRQPGDYFPIPSESLFWKQNKLCPACSQISISYQKKKCKACSIRIRKGWDTSKKNSSRNDFVFAISDFE